MTNYKRFITYLYFYEAGKKMGNVGFARVETSDELCKVTIHCSTKVASNKECKVYLLKRTKGMTISKQVAEVTSRDGNLDIKLSFERGTMEGSAFNAREAQGVVLLYSKDNYIAAKWDDSSVSYHEVVLIEQDTMVQQPIPKVIDLKKALDKGEESKDKELLEAAQIAVNEEKAETVQPRMIMVDASNIVNLGKVSDVNKMVESTQVDSLALASDSKVEESEFTETSRMNKEENVTECKEENVAECKEENNIEDKVESKEENSIEDKAESKEEVMDDIKADHNNIQVVEVVEAVEEKKKEEIKKSIKDIIRENIKLEKEKENQIEKNENFVDDAIQEPEEQVIDDTELKEEALHAANYAVPNPNLWADHPSARAILNRFVRMYPFDDGEIAECVRLEPKDIGLLPMSAWVLGNNSFLLHSYCSFRHLLFAKKLTREGCVYLLMVPGAHNNREQQLAKMFGFENFKCSRRRSMRDGEFGYWYVSITFD